MAYVALVPCESYQEEQVYGAVKEGVDLLGGIERFFHPEERILLKPNLLGKGRAGKGCDHPSGRFWRGGPTAAPGGYGALDLWGQPWKPSGDTCPGGADRGPSGHGGALRFGGRGF